MSRFIVLTRKEESLGIKFDGGGRQHGSVLREQDGVPSGRQFRRFGGTQLTFWHPNFTFKF